MSEYLKVTSILAPFGGLHLVDPVILKKACDRGTMVHQIIDAKIRRMGVLPYPELYQGYIDSFNSWIDDKRFIEAPGRFYCDDLMITGETDGFYENETGLTLVDFKTSAQEGKTWRLQGSAYMYLAKKKQFEVTEIAFVKLDKAGKKPKVYVYDYDFDTFLHCLELYRLFFEKPLKGEEFLYD